MTTRRRLGAAAVCARTERTRKLGMAVVPARARAPLWRKKRRDVCIGVSFIGAEIPGNLVTGRPGFDLVFQELRHLERGASAWVALQEAGRRLHSSLARFAAGIVAGLRSVWSR